MKCSLFRFRIRLLVQSEHLQHSFLVAVEQGYFLRVLFFSLCFDLIFQCCDTCKSSSIARASGASGTSPTTFVFFCFVVLGHFKNNVQKKKKKKGPPPPLVHPDEIPALPEPPVVPLPAMGDVISPRAPSSPFEQFLMDAKVFEYIDAFHDYGVESLDELRDMDEEDLDSIGLKPFYRKRLLKMLAQLRQGSPKTGDESSASLALAVPSDNDSDGPVDSMIMSPEVSRGDVGMSPYASQISPRKLDTSPRDQHAAALTTPSKDSAPQVVTPRTGSVSSEVAAVNAGMSPRMPVAQALTPRTSEVAPAGVSPRVPVGRTGSVSASSPRGVALPVAAVSPRTDPPPASPRNVVVVSSPGGVEAAAVSASSPRREVVALPTLVVPEPAPVVEKVRKLRRRTRKSKRRSISDASPVRSSSSSGSATPPPTEPLPASEVPVLAALAPVAEVEETDLPSPRAESSGELSSSEEAVEGDAGLTLKEGLRKVLLELQIAADKHDDMALLRGARECTSQAISVCKIVSDHSELESAVAGVNAAVVGLIKSSYAAEGFENLRRTLNATEALL